jgi:hypothetical protein
MDGYSRRDFRIPNISDPSEKRVFAEQWARKEKGERRKEKGERGKEITAGMRAWAPTPGLILDVARPTFHFISRGSTIPVTRFTGSV